MKRRRKSKDKKYVYTLGTIYMYNKSKDVLNTIRLIVKMRHKLIAHIAHSRYMYLCEVNVRAFNAHHGLSP